MLSQAVIDKDHQLHKAHEKAEQDLAKHRWHWTLDESNADRVSLREYGRLVGRSHKTVSRNAHGYARWIALSDEERGLQSLTECIVRAGMTRDREAAFEQVARQTGKAFTTVATTPEDQRVASQIIHIATDLAETSGAEVKDEIPKAAAVLPRVADQLDRIERLRNSIVPVAKPTPKPVLPQTRNLFGDLVPLGMLTGAINYLERAATSMDGLNGAAFEDADHAELLKVVERGIKATTKLTALLALLQLTIQDSSVDWDTELVKLTEQWDKEKEIPND